MCRPNDSSHLDCDCWPECVFSTAHLYSERENCCKSRRRENDATQFICSITLMPIRPIAGSISTNGNWYELVNSVRVVSTATWLLNNAISTKFWSIFALKTRSIVAFKFEVITDLWDSHISLNYTGELLGRIGGFRVGKALNRGQCKLRRLNLKIKLMESQTYGDLRSDMRLWIWPLSWLLMQLILKVIFAK